jgi:hypothetical protein
VKKKVTKAQADAAIEALEAERALFRLAFPAISARLEAHETLLNDYMNERSDNFWAVPQGKRAEAAQRAASGLVYALDILTGRRDAPSSYQLWSGRRTCKRGATGSTMGPFPTRGSDS